MQQPQQPTGGGTNSGPSGGLPEGSAAATAYAQHFAAQQALGEDLERFWDQVRAGGCILGDAPCGLHCAKLLRLCPDSRGACMPRCGAHCPSLTSLPPAPQAQGEVDEHSEVLADFKAQALPLARIKKVRRSMSAAHRCSMLVLSSTSWCTLQPAAW